MHSKNTFENNGVKNFIWNIIGSISYSMTSVVLLMVVSRNLDDYKSGIFAISFSIAQVMLTISYFQIRTYQVTDVVHEYSFEEYFTARIIMTLIMVIISGIYILILSLNYDKSIIIMILCVYRAIDGISDIFQGDFQLKGKLHLAGKLMTFQNVLSSAAFIVCIKLTKNLIVACSCLVLIYSVMLLFFILKYRGEKGEMQIIQSIKNIKNILKYCFPLFCGKFMYVFTLNSSKYAIDMILDEKCQLIYNIILMPAFTINLGVDFIFRPMQVRLSKLWMERKIFELKKLISSIGIYIVILTLVAIILGNIIGIPCLSWIYAVDLSYYRLEFLIILLGGGMNAAAVVLYYVLTVLRKNNYIIHGYITTFITSIVLSFILVDKIAILGGAITYTFSLFILVVIYFVCICRELNKCNTKILCGGQEI